jgi:hypothetical protein
VVTTQANFLQSFQAIDCYADQACFYIAYLLIRYNEKFLQITNKNERQTWV